MIKLRFLAVLAALGLMLTLPAVASAQQATPPHVFVGTAYLDGEVAPSGTVVTAWIDGEHEGSTIVYSADGRYDPLFIESATNGDVVNFSVGNAMAEQVATWEKGGADILDLNANGNNPPPVPPPSP